MNRQERAVIRAEHSNTESWKTPDGRAWIGVRRVTPQVERMVEKGWLRFHARSERGLVFLVTKCGPQRKQDARANAERAAEWRATS